MKPIPTQLDKPVAGRFHWVSNGEPHAIRRREMLSKYGPEIRKLYGYDHSTAVQVILVTLGQMAMAYAVRDWAWWQVLVAAYAISGTANQNLFCAQHEISHFLAFRKPSYNKALALFSNLVLAVPVAVKFREYHHDHHLFLGVDGGDVDLPTVFEASVVTNTLAKLVYGFTYLLFYAVRPLLVRPKAASTADLVNWVLVIGFDLLVLYLGGPKSLAYLLAGSVLGGGLHPLAGHLIAEHYMFEKGQDTYSYYGPLNKLSYNVGYHNEHHDFPQIPHTRLHKLRKIAPEYYETLYQHTSWCWVIWRFITDPEVGPWKRIHRAHREGTEQGNQAYREGACMRSIACDRPRAPPSAIDGEEEAAAEAAQLVPESPRGRRAAGAASPARKSARVASLGRRPRGENRPLN